ncbi:MAG TPA: tail fiber domain-containing protein [Chitinophagaceae bacterium]|jgi:hypothetical protein
MKQHQLACAIAMAALTCCAHSKTFSQTDWHITGNTGTNAGTNFVGTTDNQGLSLRTNNTIRMRVTAAGNIGIGTTAPIQKLDVNGNINLGKGSSLFAEGWRALRVDPSTANIFLGVSAGAYNTGGWYNTATGSQALLANQTGSYNVAYGSNALLQSSASENVAYGVNALYSNLDGTKNTAIGNAALFHNTTSSFNTAVGYAALANTTESYYNTALGFLAGNGQNNGWNNVFIGANADVNGTDYYNDVAIGESALCTGVSQVRLGNSATNSIGGYSNWTNISDGRVKKNIKENVPGLAFINKLKPITYNLDLDAADKITQRPAKKDKDGKLIAPSQLEISARIAKQQVLYTGFAAQDVEKAAKELNYDFSGVDAAKNSKDLYGLRYSDFVVPLVKAVQELSQKVEKLEAALAEKNSSDLSSASSKNVTITDASLGQNAPNPFTRNTTINYTLPQKFSSAQIIIHDNTGRNIKQVNISTSGKGAINIDASMLSAGTYSYSLVVDGKPIGSKQMVLTK